jgi:MFS family permease
VIAAFADSAAVFLVALFLLRLGGNGFLNHIALTATARHFAAGRGKALSIVSIGFSLGEAALGIAVAFLLDHTGRRASFLAVAAIAGALALAGIALFRGAAVEREPDRRSRPRGAWRARGARAHRHTRALLAWCAPLYFATPLVMTSFIFHQGVIAAAKGLTIQWFALSFAAFAAARVIAGIAVGPAIDRYGATRLFVAHLVPLCIGVAVLAAASGAWIVPVYWVLSGITGGLVGTLQVAFLAEHLAPSELGRARSAFGSMMIVAAAAGPALYGALIAQGCAVVTLLWGSVAAMLAVTLVGAAALRRVKLHGFAAATRSTGGDTDETR